MREIKIRCVSTLPEKERIEFEKRIEEARNSAFFKKKMADATAFFQKIPREELEKIMTG